MVVVCMCVGSGEGAGFLPRINIKLVTVIKSVEVDKLSYL